MPTSNARASSGFRRLGKNAGAGDTRTDGPGLPRQPLRPWLESGRIAAWSWPRSSRMLAVTALPPPVEGHPRFRVGRNG